MPKDTTERTAELYRMVMPDHVCPFGLKSRALLKRHGFEVEDHPLRSREETEALMKRLGVETTPQIFIGDERVGGYEELRVRLGIDPPEEDRSDTSYTPVIAIFSVAALLALGLSWHQYGTVLQIRAAEWFVSLAMTFLAMQKLQDVEGFSLMFLNYDLLARRWVRYAAIYPFAEAAAGILMTAGALIWIAAPISLFIGTVGAVSIAKAVYVEGRSLKCACVGGGSSVPLGFVSMTESLMMVLMGLWMPFSTLAAL